MAMQVFPVPNQRNILGVSIQRTNARVNLSQTYRELDAQVVGSMAFVTGVSNPRMLRSAPVSIGRPAMNDEIRGMKIIGGMACKYGGGSQSLNLLLVTPSGDAPMPGRPANFYVIKTPSHGRWDVPNEFTLTKREEELINDILPVFCDPGYDGTRTERLAEIQKKYGIPSRGVRPVAGVDTATIAKMGTDAKGNSNIAPDTEPNRHPGVHAMKGTNKGHGNRPNRDEHFDEHDVEDRHDPDSEELEEIPEEEEEEESYEEEEVYEDYREEGRRNQRKAEERRRNHRDRERRKKGDDKPFDWEHPFGDDESAAENPDNRQDFQDADGSYDDGIPYGSDDEYDEMPNDIIDPEIRRDWERQQPKQPSDLKVILMRILLGLLVAIVLALVGVVGFFVFKALFPSS